MGNGTGMTWYPTEREGREKSREASRFWHGRGGEELGQPPRQGGRKVWG